LRDKGIKILLEKDRPIDVLTGADVYGKLLIGQQEILQCGLVAIETYLGWIVTGQIQSCTKASSMMALSMFVHSEAVSKVWELDVLGIQDPSRRSNEQAEMAVQAYFRDTVKVNDNRHYGVRLPWIGGHPLVPRNINLANKRLENVLRKLGEGKLKGAYDEVFVNCLQEGITEEITMAQWDEGHYPPHRPVVKESGTTRVRPMFDASVREHSQPYLNQFWRKV
jgi:hypothetical protein